MATQSVQNPSRTKKTKTKGKTMSEARVKPAHPALSAQASINPRTGRVWSLADQEYSVWLDGLKAEVTADPKKAKQFLVDVGYLTIKGKVTKRYSGG